MMNSTTQVTKVLFYSFNCVFLFALIGYFGIPAVNAKEGAKVSGEIRSGFRIIEVDPSNRAGNFIVYRGDYIKFRYPQRFGQLLLKIESLRYSGILAPDPDQAPFFKMKKVGTYPFTLGEGGGVIEVIDLVRPNYSEVTAEEASDLLENRKPFILDVRTHKEYEHLHLVDSYLIPIQELQARIGELEGQKHEDIFVYCATGNRSTVAARILVDAGFKRIFNLRHGVHDWARRGYTYITGK